MKPLINKLKSLITSHKKISILVIVLLITLIILGINVSYSVLNLQQEYNNENTEEVEYTEIEEEEKVEKEFEINEDIDLTKFDIPEEDAEEIYAAFSKLGKAHTVEYKIHRCDGDESCDDEETMVDFDNEKKYMSNETGSSPGITSYFKEYQNQEKLEILNLDGVEEEERNFESSQDFANRLLEQLELLYSGDDSYYTYNNMNKGYVKESVEDSTGYFYRFTIDDRTLDLGVTIDDKGFIKEFSVPFVYASESYTFSSYNEELEIPKLNITDNLLISKNTYNTIKTAFDNLSRTSKIELKHKTFCLDIENKRCWYNSNGEINFKNNTARLIVWKQAHISNSDAERYSYSFKDELIFENGKVKINFAYNNNYPEKVASYPTEEYDYDIEKLIPNAWNQIDSMVNYKGDIDFFNNNMDITETTNTETFNNEEVFKITIGVKAVGKHTNWESVNKKFSYNDCLTNYSLVLFLDKNKEYPIAYRVEVEDDFITGCQFEPEYNIKLINDFEPPLSAPFELVE